MRQLTYALLVLTLALAIDRTVTAEDSPRELIAASIEKNGGEKKLSKYAASTMKWKGTVHIVGSPLTVTGESQAQGMDQYRLNIALSVDGQAINYTSVLNRDRGWERLYEMTNEMPAGKLTETKGVAYTSWIAKLMPLKDPAFKLTSAGESEVGDRKAVGINVIREGQSPVKLLLDKETLRVVRTEATIRDDATSTQVTQETTYSDFKMFDGVPHATKIVIKRDGQPHAELEVQDFKLVEKLEDGAFAKP